VKRRRRGWSPDNHAYQHRSPDPTKIERATATSTVALFILFLIINLVRAEEVLLVQICSTNVSRNV